MSGAPQNSMGASSSHAGTGPIDGYDPLWMSLRRRLQRRFAGVLDNYNRQDMYSSSDPEDQEAGTKDKA